MKTKSNKPRRLTDIGEVLKRKQMAMVEAMTKGGSARARDFDGNIVIIVEPSLAGQQASDLMMWRGEQQEGLRMTVGSVISVLAKSRIYIDLEDAIRVAKGWISMIVLFESLIDNKLVDRESFDKYWSFVFMAELLTAIKEGYDMQPGGKKIIKKVDMDNLMKYGDDELVLYGLPENYYDEEHAARTKWIEAQKDRPQLLDNITPTEEE